LARGGADQLGMRVRVAAVTLVAVACSACGETSTKAESRIRVPNVVGASWGTAIERIAGAGLCIGTISMDPGAIMSPADSVLRQTPHAGAKVAPHARVSLKVSPSGPSGWIVSYTLRGCRKVVEYAVEPRG
jgi:PASTA domain